VTATVAERPTLTTALSEALTLQEQVRHCVQEALAEGKPLDVAFLVALDCMRAKGQTQPLYDLFGQSLVGLLYTGEARLRLDGLPRPSGPGPMSPEDFSALYAAHSCAVLKYLQSRVRHDVAEELCQETFLAVMRSPSFEVKGRALWETRGALITRARWMSLDHWKREQRLRTSTLDGEDGLGNRLADPSQTGVFTALGKRLDLEAILAAFPAKQRRALELRHGAGHTMTEVARLMNVEYQEAKQLVQKATDTLRAILEGEAEPPSAPSAPVARTGRKIDLSQLQRDEALLETQYRIDGEWIVLGNMRRHQVQKAQQQHEAHARMLATVHNTLQPGETVRQRFNEESLRALMGAAQEAGA
jgi:RNA polymerase sigma factor (sigma-70 family)